MWCQMLNGMNKKKYLINIYVLALVHGLSLHICTDIQCGCYWTHNTIILAVTNRNSTLRASCDKSRSVI